MNLCDTVRASVKAERVLLRASLRKMLEAAPDRPGYWTVERAALDKARAHAKHALAIIPEEGA